METITTFIILKEGTFGYTRDFLDKPFLRMNIMAVDVLKGGDPLLLDKQVLCSPGDCRIATVEDFERFRVSVKDYANNPQYHLVNSIPSETQSGTTEEKPLVSLLEYKL